MRRHAAGRGRWMRIAVAVVALICCVASGALASAPVVHPRESSHGSVQRTAPSHDILVAGGIDGRVYAINAWTGDVLWMFDSGGPMVDSSDCSIPSSATQPSKQRDQVQTATVNAAGSSHSARSESALERQWKVRGGAVAKASASGAASLAQLIHSYDGRLYHIDGSSVRELEMNMIDIINANGPVRLSSPASRDSAASADSDLLLFGEKETKIFSLDATKGVIQPYLSTASSAAAPTLLFGRAEFKTRAVHAVNMSAARCFTISEYFLQFTEQSKCSMGEDTGKPLASPQIIVLPKDADAVNPDEEESTIAAFDPWSNKQLWELQIPRFDVVSVFGVSSHRGASFFKWSIDGPSSTATERKNALVLSGHARGKSTESPASTSDQPRQITSADTAEPGNESKRLVKTVSREWSSMQSQFRLRLLGGNYFLEQNEDEDEVSTTSTDASYFGEDARLKRKRRVFWESMESNGKRGVFITYYHVGAVTIGVLVGCVLIAWGFYVKGLSASGVIHSLDHHEFLPSGHIHQLTIERPGQETITISSSITRSLLMDAAASFGVGPKSLPMLENGDETFTEAGNASAISQVRLDPETEAMLLEKFSKMLALEAAAALAGPRLSKNNLMQLESDPDSSTASTTRTSSTLTLLSDSSVSNRRHSLLEDDPTSRMDHGFDRAMTEDNDGRFVPVIEELENSGSDLLCETLDCDREIEEQQPRPVLNDSDEAGDTSECSGSADETGSSDEESSDSSDASAELSQDDATNGSSESATDVSNPRKTSNASSASSANEQEVLFPFVCQSRFANEFVELSALGKGGFGQVMLAENRLDGRKYAIKRVGLHLKHQTSKTLQKFLREVKILALLDHPNIVRYYQAWLEKVEEGTITSMGMSSEGDSSAPGTAPPRNYSMSNLLAPISEMEYSNQVRSAASFYSNGSFGGDDDGFDWERDSADGGEEDVWREEDLAPSPASRHPKRQQIIEPNRPTKAAVPRKPVGGESTPYANEQCDHWLYIQMQYCAGRTLADYLSLPTRSMEQPKLFKIFTQIASAIAHVHSCGLIHRDLKPANIFVADTDGDSIKLGDFGLSRYAANVNLASTQTTVEEISTSSVFMNGGANFQAQYSVSKWAMSVSNMSESQDITAGVGTYLYASPEQVAGKKYNAKTDMYSLGMILFELCHERFMTTMERYVTLRNARERVFPPEFEWRKKSPEIMEMLDRLLHQDPMQRPDAAEVVQWSQEMYEFSLAQHHASSSKLAMGRSPIHQQRSFHGTMPTLNLDQSGSPSSAFSLQVEAGMVAGDDEGGERRLPNHNLLKEICDIIAEVSKGRMEIKKCGLHLQDGGVQVLDFVLDPHVRQDEGDASVEEADVALVNGQKSELVAVIQARPGVRSVRLDF